MTPLCTIDSSIHVALLRGVNVGGKNALSMKDLTRMFLAAGCEDARTYIQSGNVVFRAAPDVSATVALRVAEDIKSSFNLSIPIVLRTADQLRDVVRTNPYLDQDGNGTRVGANLHVIFLSDLPNQSQLAKLDPARSHPDTFSVHGREIYLNLPNGAGSTKLTNAYFDSKLSTISTARNWRTVLKLFEMTLT